MKKYILLILSITLVLGSVAAQDSDVPTIIEPQFKPMHPEVAAQGFSFVAVAEGYNSLYTNPAGFARGKGSFTLAAPVATAYFLPDQNFMDNLESFTSMMNSGEEIDPIAALDLFSQDLDGDGEADDSILYGSNAPGFGANLSAGLGYTGHGVGVGVVTAADAYIWGPNALGLSVNSHITAAGIGGFAFPIKFSDDIVLYVGADARVMYRLRPMKLSLTSVMGLLGGGVEGESEPFDPPLLAGTAVGFDAGVLFELGPLQVGAAMRDLFNTRFNYTEVTLFQLETEGPLAEGADVVGDFLIPMNLHVGAAFHPDLGKFSFVFDPKIHFEYEHIFHEQATGSFWTRVHAGAEIRFLRFLKVRGGINQGYFTLGAGAKLLFLDINAAIFLQEMGNYTGTRARPGAVVEAAIRF